jgi:hypothetical protein
MSLIMTAERAGILDRAIEISADLSDRATQQIRSGAGQIRAAMSRSRRRRQ